MKTLSDTPRTDAEYTWNGLRDLCRQFERELAEADRCIAQLKHCSEIETYAAAEARIAELEQKCKLKR